MQKIGEDRTERVDYRPGRIVVKVFVTPKYACAAKLGGVKQALAPPGRWHVVVDLGGYAGRVNASVSVI